MYIYRVCVIWKKVPNKSKWDIYIYKILLSWDQKIEESLHIISMEVSSSSTSF